MTDQTSELKLKILWQPSGLRYKPGAEFIRHSKHGKRSVDQVRVVLEASFEPGCLDQSGINTRTESLAANPFELSILGQYREGEAQPRRQDGVKWFGTSGLLPLAGSSPPPPALLLWPLTSPFLE